MCHLCKEHSSVPAGVHTVCISGEKLGLLLVKKQSYAEDLGDFC